MDTLLKNALLATPIGNEARKGKAQREIRLIENAMVGIKDGKVAYAGPADSTLSASNEVNCGGRLLTPGLVDAHTHLVFGGWRQKELPLKLAGVQYLDILKAGGGILSTVEHTRAASENSLEVKGMALLLEMQRLGVTTCEIKTGYGLDIENEIKQLSVIRKLRKTQPMDIVATFMGAHAYPKEYSDDRPGYIEYLIGEMLPAVAKENLAEFCDIFCETAVFTPEESRRILLEAMKYGLRPKIHADEIDPIGGAKIAAEIGAISAEHLIQVSDAGINALAQRDVTAVLLPGTSFYLDKPYARARDMINAGVAVAVATDFNPGSNPCTNMQFVMTLACLKYKMTPAEVLTAVTLNGAAALGRASVCGSIELGKKADIVMWEAEDLEYIFYRYGSNLVCSVIKDGKFTW